MAFQFLFNRRDKEVDQQIMSSSEEDEAAASEEPKDERTPLCAVAVAFQDLSEFVNSIGIASFSSGQGHLPLKSFCDACSLASVLFGCLGIAFKFAELEYCSKVRNLVEASDKYGTLNEILEVDVGNNTVRTAGSLSRNLRRVRQGLDLIRALFENFLSSDYGSLKEAASTAYAQVFAPYHTWAIRTAVYAGMCALPTREQLLLNLNETDESAEREMRKYIKASLPVIEYIDKLYISKNISLDW
ncbi:ACD11 homolog protein [Diospyros lotus]|uniref:ACD11 homolog protein n=1 Tax=Diospyros lotus TaxID=55363 RepID=UPI00225BE833|nr:ACD11 homolog protein [Diospyros lotus]